MGVVCLQAARHYLHQSTAGSRDCDGEGEEDDCRGSKGGGRAMRIDVDGSE